MSAIGRHHGISEGDGHVSAASCGICGGYGCLTCAYCCEGDGHVSAESCGICGGYGCLTCAYCCERCEQKRRPRETR